MKAMKKQSAPARSNETVFEAKFNLEAYMERTKRNHYWIGGQPNQMRLRDLKVGVAGLGGMGSHIAEHLARLGVGHLRIADPDTIEATNLNRQAIAHRSTIGMTKVAAAIRELRDVAEDFELRAFPEGITEENAARFVEGCDLIVDEIDVYPLRAHVLLHREARKRGIPVYSAYSVGLGIHFYKFHGDDYTFEDFLGVPPEQWDKPTAAFLIDRFGPMPSYLEGKGTAGFQREIESGGTPIFGPSTLLGHSAVVMRLLVDLFGDSLRNAWSAGEALKRTPVMPTLLILDLGELSLKETTLKKRARNG